MEIRTRRLQHKSEKKQTEEPSSLPKAKEKETSKPCTESQKKEITAPREPESAISEISINDSQITLKAKPVSKLQRPTGLPKPTAIASKGSGATAAQKDQPGASGKKKAESRIPMIGKKFGFKK